MNLKYFLNSKDAYLPLALPISFAPLLPETENFFMETRHDGPLGNYKESIVTQLQTPTCQIKEPVQRIGSFSQHFPLTCLYCTPSFFEKQGVLGYLCKIDGREQLECSSLERVCS